ncbi:MAG: hypothetical protein IJS32_03495 [Kiritimatiellae bacterium]|nr:hypothetical protein [Kiritimatiellia bacterium]
MKVGGLLAAMVPALLWGCAGPDAARDVAESGFHAPVAPAAANGNTHAANRPSGGAVPPVSDGEAASRERQAAAVTRLLEGKPDPSAPQPAAEEGREAGKSAPRAWVLPDAGKAESETKYDAPAPPEKPAGTRISLSSDSLFGDGPLAWRLLLEGHAETGGPQLDFRGAAWRFFRGSRDAWWLGMETDDTGENRATFSLEYAF